MRVHEAIRFPRRTHRGPSPLHRWRASYRVPMDEREAAWDAILEALPRGWRAAQPSHDPARNEVEVVARAPKLGGRRGPAPEYVIGRGADELGALRDLARRLAER
jgi:hypothetical protein